MFDVYYYVLQCDDMYWYVLMCTSFGSCMNNFDLIVATWTTELRFMTMNAFWNELHYLYLAVLFRLANL